MGPSLQLSTCMLFWGFLGLFVPAVEGTKPFLPCSVFLGYSVFTLSGAPRRTDGRTDGGNGRCHGNEVTRGMVARDPYATCKVSS